jgi:hypothetical protein
VAGSALPAFAAWRHLGSQAGFEVVFLRPLPDGLHLDGHAAAIEAGEAFAVRFAIELDARGRTRSARVSGQSSLGSHAVALTSDGEGAWLVDDTPAPRLDGCLDVDLEFSALTNAFPVRRLGLEPGDAADAPAAYVRALDLRVERLEQRYLRVDDGTGSQRFDYTAPAFDVRCEIVYDAAGLVLDYPEIAVRAG